MVRPQLSDAIFERPFVNSSVGKMFERGGNPERYIGIGRVATLA